MDLEILFYQMHLRIMVMYLRIFSPRARRRLERFALVQSILLLLLLAFLHLTFVKEKGCLAFLSAPAEVQGTALSQQQPMVVSIHGHNETIHRRTVHSDSRAGDVDLEEYQIIRLRIESPTKVLARQSVQDLLAQMDDASDASDASNAVDSDAAYIGLADGYARSGDDGGSDDQARAEGDSALDASLAARQHRFLKSRQSSGGRAEARGAASPAPASPATAMKSKPVRTAVDALNLADWLSIYFAILLHEDSEKAEPAQARRHRERDISGIDIDEDGGSSDRDDSDSDDVDDSDSDSDNDSDNSERSQRGSILSEAFLGFVHEHLPGGFLANALDRAMTASSAPSRRTSAERSTDLSPAPAAVSPSRPNAGPSVPRAQPPAAQRCFPKIGIPQVDGAAVCLLDDSTQADALLDFGSDYGDVADVDSAAFSLRDQHFQEERLQDMLAAIDYVFADSVYEFSFERGFLRLSESARRRHKVSVLNVTITAEDKCMGGPLLQFVLETFLGYDTVVLNAFVNLTGGKGFLTNLDTGDFYRLDNIGMTREESSLLFKLDIVVTSLFLFTVTTVLVGLVLRETQLTALKFTMAIDSMVHGRAQLSGLLFVNAVKSLAFFLVLVGMTYFLTDFLEDQLLSLLIFSLVWVSEMFTVISARTQTTLLYWSKFFFLYQVMFYLYFFTFPTTFSYLAFSACASFTLHAALYFYNNFEVAAVTRNEISSQHIRQLNNNPMLLRVFERSIQLVVPAVLQVPTPNAAFQAHVEPVAMPLRAFPVLIRQRRPDGEQQIPAPPAAAQAPSESGASRSPPTREAAGAAEAAEAAS